MRQKYKRLLYWIKESLGQMSTKMGLSVILAVIGWKVEPTKVDAVVTIIGVIVGIILILHNENPEKGQDERKTKKASPEGYDV